MRSLDLNISMSTNLVIEDEQEDVLFSNSLGGLWTSRTTTFLTFDANFSVINLPNPLLPPVIRTTSFGQFHGVPSFVNLNLFKAKLLKNEFVWEITPYASKPLSTDMTVLSSTFRRPGVDFKISINFSRTFSGPLSRIRSNGAVTTGSKGRRAIVDDVCCKAAILSMIGTWITY